MQKFPKKNQAGRYGKNGKIKINTADKWFSIFIRLRGIIRTVPGVEFYVKCVTCGNLLSWKKRFPGDNFGAECGHFVTRDRPMTRFHEENCHPQCHRCNYFGKGEQAKHAIAIDKMYGSGTAEKLINLGGIRGQKSYQDITLKEIANKYRLKSKALAKELGVKIN